MATNLRRHKRSKDALTQSDISENERLRIHCRYNPACDGKPFKGQPFKTFEQTIVTVFNRQTETVRDILNEASGLLVFSSAVWKNRKGLTPEQLQSAELWNQSVAIADQHGFSFCEYVAKRLTLLWKDGKLKAKGPRYDRNFKKRKKRKFVTTVLSVD